MEKLVLLAEDDPADVLLIQRAARRTGFGFRLERVEGGQQAIDYLSGTHPYADRERFPLPSHLILDVKMPGKTGLEVLAWLRAHPRLNRSPVVMFSSSREPSDVRAAYDLGVDAYLVKPLDLDRLDVVLRALSSWVGAGQLDPLQELIPPAN